MKVRKLTNESDETINVETSEGRNIPVSPKRYIQDVDITNLDEVKDKVRVVHDLNEVQG